jgi:hypothetical protein
VGTCNTTCRPDIFPGNTGLKPGESAVFSVWVFSATDVPITWTIKEGSSGGTISGAGVYTAPSVEGIYHLTASSTANPSQTSTVTIVVTNTQFTPVAELITPRFDHTASLLPNGQVFIAGGIVRDYWDRNSDLYAVTAELYDPVGTIHASVQVSRYEHSATVLANGDVLLAGGGNDTQDALITADLFKAATGTIQPTGSMNTPRIGHTATLLLDGRVLLAGGGGIDEKAIRSAELYDPASGKFSPAGDMTALRSGHSAALLPNGKVLIAGGGAAGADLYDPATNAFSWVPGVSTNRCQTTAAPLADGRVLISGGVDCSNTVLDTAEIYDPATGESTPTGKLLAPQYGGTATRLPDGRVLLVGGNANPYLSQIYNPATGSFAFGPHPKAPLWGGHTATLLLDGSVLLVGEDDGTTAVLFK